MRTNSDGYTRDGEEDEPEQMMRSGRLASLRNTRIFASLEVPAYRLFLISQVFEVMGMAALMMVRSLLVYRLTESTAIIGIIAICQAVPNLLLILFGGAIADRVQKKYVMLVGELGLAVVSLVTALALVTGYLSVENEGSWWILAVGAVIHGAIMGMISPSRQSIIPEFVGEERLLNASSLLTIGTSSMRLLIPLIAGFVIESFDFHVAYFAMTAMYFIAFIFIYRFPLRSKAMVDDTGTLAAIIDGIRYVRKHRTILFILIITLATTILSMPYQQLMAVFADDILQVGASGLGILMSLSGAGTVAGALLLASLPNKKRGLMLLLSGIISGIALILFSLSTSWALSLGTVIFTGVGQAGRVVLGGAIIQYYIESEYRGRVMSVFQMQIGLNSFGAFLAGVLAESIGVQWAVGSFAALLFFVSLLAMVLFPQVRRLD